VWNGLSLKNPYSIAYPAYPKTENNTDEVDGVNVRTAAKAKLQVASFNLPAT
jgi:hypothetical protein